MVKKLLALFVLTALLLTACGVQNEPAQPSGTEAAQTGVYKSYSMVVTSWDTPNQVLDALRQEGVAYTEYFGGTLLRKDQTAALGEKATIYLCEGTYEVDSGDFIQTDCSTEVTILGAGQDKTIVRAADGLEDNAGAAIHVTGDGKTATVRGMTISGFRMGVWVENASGVRMEELHLYQNTFAGVQFTGASGCQVLNCLFEENGAPRLGDTGFGLMLDAASHGNTGSGNRYVNNGNQNAVDCPALWDGYTDNQNDIALEFRYDLPAEQPSLKDPVMEALNARPGADALRYEFEDGGFDNGASLMTDGNMPEGSGGKYVFLSNGTLTLKVQVPQAGYYRMFVVGGSDDGNNKCDRVSVNDGPQYLTSYPYAGTPQWQLSQPGTENWVNNVLTPQTPTEGFYFEAGENTITITANWGYCAYDCVYLEPVTGGADS